MAWITPALRAAVQRFGAAPDAEAAAALARELLAVLGAAQSSLADPGAALACAPGCNFCCHQRVAVLPHEALALLHHLRTALPADEAAAVLRQVRDRAHRIAPLSADEHRRANLPCALLRNGRCSAYAVRPLACASYHSLSRSRCEQAFQRPEDLGTPRNSRPVLLELKRCAESLGALLRVELSAAGLPVEVGELHTQLWALVEGEDLGV